MRLNSPAVMRWVILIAAILVWVNIYAFIDQTKVFAAPLTVDFLKSDLAVANPVTTIDATVSGSLREMGNLSASSLQFSVDASHITSVGKYTLEVKPKVTPKKLKVLNYSPKELTLTVESISSKTVTVVALAQGNPQDKFSVQSLTAVPSQVTVIGAPTLLDKISEAKAYVNVSGQRSSFTAPVEVSILDGSNKKITTVRTEPSSVKVNVDIIAGASVRNLGVKPVFTGELPGGFWIQEVQFDPPIMQVRGPQQALNKLVSLSSSKIDLTNRRTSFSEQVAVDLPDNIEVVGENLVLAHVVIGSSEGTRQFDVIPQYVNVTEGFGVTTISPASIQVVVSGDPKTINQLKRTDIKLNLDLKGTLSGSNQITITPAMFSLPPNFQVVSFTPDKVDVVLTRL